MSALFGFIVWAAILNVGLVIQTANRKLIRARWTMFFLAYDAVSICTGTAYLITHR